MASASCRKAGSTSRTAGKSENADIYGAGWWVTPAEGDGRPYKSRIDTGPQRDAFSAEGFEGSSR